jgi:hypothetical protein
LHGAAGRGRNVDDVTALARSHAWKNGLRQRNNAEEARLEHVVRIDVFGLLDSRALAESGFVDQDIHPAEPVFRRR